MGYIQFAISYVLAQILTIGCKYFTLRCRFIRFHLVPLLPLLDPELKEPSQMGQQGKFKKIRALESEIPQSEFWHQHLYDLKTVCC